VERSVAGLGRCRRLAKDWEKTIASAIAMASPRKAGGGSHMAGQKFQMTREIKPSGEDCFEDIKNRLILYKTLQNKLNINFINA